MIKTFIKDTIKYFPAHAIPAVIGFISIPIITRLFMPYEYGNYSLVIAVVAILTTLLGWLPMSIIRFYPVYERDKKLEIFYGNVINITFISISALVIIFIMAVYFIKPHISLQLATLMYLGAGVFAVMAIFEVLQHFLRSKRQVNYYSGFAIWKSVMGFGLGIGLIILFKLGIEALLWGAILSIVLILPLLWKISTKGISSIRFKINLSLSKEMMSYAFPLVMGNLAAWILSLSDRYVLEFLRGSKEVGIYSAGYYISEKSIMLIGALLGLASGPIIMQIWEKGGEAESKEYLTKVTRYYLIACIPAVAGLSVLAKPIIDIFTGAEYHEAYKIVPFVTLGALLLGLQSFFHVGFLFYKKTAFITYAIVIAGLLNICLNFIFIPKYGYVAAAVTTLISYAALLFIMIIGSVRIFTWKFPFESLIKSICAAVIMGSVVYFICNWLTSAIWINLTLSIFIGGLIYFALLLLFREFNSQEKRVIKQTLRHICCCLKLKIGINHAE